MRVRDVLVQSAQVRRVPVEVLERGAVLKDAGDGAQRPPLTRQQSRTRAELHHVKPVRSHDRGVHVAIVDEVTHDLNTHTQQSSHDPAKEPHTFTHSTVQKSVYQ